MQPITINQEVLLFAGTSFSKHQCCSKNTLDKSPAKYFLMEELEKACWSGILCELLPELTPNLFIWNILTAEHFLLVNQGTYPCPIEAETSVDPHLFLLTNHLN